MTLKIIWQGRKAIVSRNANSGRNILENSLAVSEVKTDNILSNPTPRSSAQGK